MQFLLLFAQLFNELFPIVHAAVQVVQRTVPAATPGAQKFETVLNAVNDVVAAAPAATISLANAKAAAASGNTGELSDSIGHMIELSVSLSKSLGLFSKAAIVQNAAPLPNSGGDSAV